MRVDVEFHGATLILGHGRVSRRILHDFTHVFPSGSVTAIVGPSGSGKTSLLRAILGEVSPTQGRILVGRRKIATLSASERSRLRRSTVTTIHQDLNLVESLTAWENVLFGLRLAGIKNAHATADEWLERLGLDGVRNMFPATLSGGEQQRVAIARSLAGPHSVVLADEPPGALDETNTRIVIDQFKHFSATGKCCIVVTHDPLVAAGADQVLTFHDGILQ